MPSTLQAKLLRVLENQEVLRIGSNEPIKVDVRLLSATHRHLETAIREGEFRADLSYRLAGVTIRLSVSASRHFAVQTAAPPPYNLSRSQERTRTPSLVKGETPMRKFVAVLLRSLATWTA